MVLFERFRLSKALTTIVVTAAVFSDTLLYSLVIPLLPSILAKRARVKDAQLETWISVMLAAYGASSLVAPRRHNHRGTLCASALLTFLLPVFVGPFTDRFKSKKTPFTLGLLVLIAATVMFFWSKHIVLLVVARALQGCSTTMVWTSGMTFLSSRLGTERSGSAMGIAITGNACGELIGPALGGLMYNFYGETGVVAVAVAVVGFDIVLRLLIIDPPPESGGLQREPLLAADRREESEDQRPVEEAICDPGKNTKSVHHHKSVYWALITNFDFMASLGAIWISTDARVGLEATIPLFINSAFDWSESKGGLILLIMVAPSLLSPLFTRLNNKIGPRWPTCLSFLAMGLLFVALGFSTANSVPIKVIFGLIIFGIGACLFLITTAHMGAVSVAANEAGKDDEDASGGKAAAPSATAFAFMNQALAAGILVGPLWAGPLHEHAGWLPMCASFLGVCVVSAGIMAFCWRKWVPLE